MEGVQLLFASPVCTEGRKFLSSKEKVTSLFFHEAPTNTPHASLIRETENDINGPIGKHWLADRKTDAKI